ncbi:hypothetical protein Areg01_89540 [Actinoplanes regularis]|nr:hypothetical protein Areg01_89540 [Actinoplanes regularis]
MPAVEIDLRAGMEPPARLRRRVSPGREHRLSVRLSDEELKQVREAAGRAQLTPTGYAGEAAVAAARASVAGPDVPATRAELARDSRSYGEPQSSFGSPGPQWTLLANPPRRC